MTSKVIQPRFLSISGQFPGHRLPPMPPPPQQFTILLLPHLGCCQRFLRPNNNDCTQKQITETTLIHKEQPSPCANSDNNGKTRRVHFKAHPPDYLLSISMIICRLQVRGGVAEHLPPVHDHGILHIMPWDLRYHPFQVRFP